MSPRSPKPRNKSSPSCEPPRGFEDESAQEVEPEPEQQNNENQGKERQSWTDVQCAQDSEKRNRPSHCWSEASLTEAADLPLFPEDGNKQSALATPEIMDSDGSFPETGYLSRPHVLLGARSWSLRLIPRFVRPLPADMPLEDVEFLQAKGALTIPDTTLREALIKAYLEHVHPLLPVINIEDFVESLIEENDLNLRISLLFLQAVMFAGSAYVDWSLLAEAGFKSRKEARATLYQRVRVRISVRKNFSYVGLICQTAFVPV